MSPSSRRRLNVAIEPSQIEINLYQKRRKHSSQNLLNRALVLDVSQDEEKEENSNSVYFFCRDMCPNIRSVQKLDGDKTYLVVFNQSEDRNNFMKKCKTSKYNIQPFQNDHQE